MPATLLAFADNQIYLILWANRYVISDDIIYELKYDKQAFLSSLRYLSLFTTDTLFINASDWRNIKTPEVCFKQLQEFFIMYWQFISITFYSPCQILEDDVRWKEHWVSSWLPVLHHWDQRLCLFDFLSQAYIPCGLETAIICSNKHIIWVRIFHQFKLDNLLDVIGWILQSISNAFQKYRDATVHLETSHWLLENLFKFKRLQ